jgi:hypothetical protein
MSSSGTARQTVVPMTLGATSGQRASLGPAHDETGVVIKPVTSSQRKKKYGRHINDSPETRMCQRGGRTRGRAPYIGAHTRGPKRLVLRAWCTGATKSRAMGGQ